jgi:signal peptidase I
LLCENQAIGNFIDKRNNEQNKSILLNSAQTSDLRPQSFNLSTHNFVQICSELLSQGHLVKFKAPGHSMYPTICDGDLITVEPKKPSDVCVGDIILYHHENGVVAHRVVNIKIPQSSVLRPQHFLLLRGDAAMVFDDPVRADQILGKVTLVERDGRRIDPYSLRTKLQYKTRRLVSRIKRSLRRPNSRPA